MKRKILFVIACTVFGLLGNYTSAQCLNDASTNPASPINNNLKDANGSPLNNHTVNEFRNIFNWGSHNGSSWNGIPVYTNNLNWSFTPGTPMFSPFSTQMPLKYNYLYQNGAFPSGRCSATDQSIVPPMAQVNPEYILSNRR